MADKDVKTEKFGNAIGLAAMIIFPLMLAAAFYLSAREKEADTNGQ